MGAVEGRRAPSVFQARELHLPLSLKLCAGKGFEFSVPNQKVILREIEGKTMNPLK